VNRFHDIRPACENDIFFIHALEMDPANIFVHSWDEATHHANLLDPKHHYFIAEDIEKTSLGYAILIEDEAGSIEWKRIIVARRGNGIGSSFMEAILRHFSHKNKTRKIWLDVYAQNDRARHVYQNLGFVETGEDLKKVPGERLVIMEYHQPRLT